MKEGLLNALKYVLRQLARFTIAKYRPAIIGVTGSVGKTSTKLAIAAVLSKERTVRAARGNFNGEVGLPLAVLGDWKEEEAALVSRDFAPGTHRIAKLIFFTKVILVSIFRLLVRGKYPEILVLEYGIDRPGDMKYLVRIARPNMTVLTAVGEIPAHVEFFESPQEVAREKGRLIECLSAAGFAILNYDDETVMDLRDRTRAHVVTFGFGKGATVQISNFEHRTSAGRPTGISFKLEYGGSFVPVRIDNVFGRSYAYAVGAATAVGVLFGMNLIKIAEAIESYKPAPHRMQLVEGKKETWIIDDSYNASPLSVHNALHVLHDLPGKRKIAVLGDMLEIGEYAIEAHERIGALAAKAASVLVTVGPRAKFIAESAKKSGMQKARIESFETAEDAVPLVEKLLRKNDLVLVKASHAMNLEKIVETLKI